MSKFRFALVGAGAALALAAAAALANVGSLTPGSSDSHGDAVASAARTTCPHGPDGVHGRCVSAVASSKSEESTSTSKSAPTDPCKAKDSTEGTSEKSGGKTEDANERGATTSKSADKGEDSSEKSAKHSEDSSEKQVVKACEAAKASNP